MTKRSEISAAILKGLADAKASGYDKPSDVAVCVRVALADAGFKIVRRPKHRNTDLALSALRG